MLFITKAQNYNPIINYYLNGTPTNGVKIRTNIPYTNGSQMPNIIIEGYNYGDQTPISLSIVWYIYSGDFIHYAISSSTSYNPEVKLCNESGKVVIFINDRKYCSRFSIRGFAQGMQENASWFSGWTIADEALSGSNTVILPYKNINNLPNIVEKNGNVGIGTLTPTNKLDVNGTVHAKEVKVDLTGWPDFVFKKAYHLPSLEEVEKAILENGYLPNMPSEQEVLESGLNLGENQKLLLQKIEELTLYTIDQNKRIKELEEENKQLRSLTERVEKLEATKNQK